MYRGEIAVDDGHLCLTHGQLIDQAERLANAFDAIGLKPGTPVGLLSENRSEYVLADVAIALARRVRVAFNARLHLEEFRYIAADAELGALFYSRRFAAQAAALAQEFGLVPIALEEPADAGQHSIASLIAGAPADAVIRASDDEGAAWISYTSGTTGRPKGVVLSHRAVREVALNLLLEMGPVHPGEQIVLTQPVSHGAGYFELPYVMSGAGVFVMRRFDPEQVWQLSGEPAIRTLKIVPAMLEPIFDAEPARGSSGWGYETIVYGASGIAPGLLDVAVQRFGPTLIQDYGQSEAPVTITCLHKRDHLDPTARQSAGRPWRSVAVEVRDVDGEVAAPGELGEVYVRGQHMMSGYHRKPAETAGVLADGWLRTNDLATVDDRGFVYLRGRRDEMIISGGFNVAPREVEDVLSSYRDVSEAVVLGVPDERWGQAVTAVVRPAAGASITAAELLAYARPRLGIRAPKRLEVWPEIPRNAYGKIDRAAIRSSLDGAVQHVPDRAAQNAEPAHD